MSSWDGMSKEIDQNLPPTTFELHLRGLPLDAIPMLKEVPNSSWTVHAVGVKSIWSTLLRSYSLYATSILHQEKGPGPWVRFGYLGSPRAT